MGEPEDEPLELCANSGFQELQDDIRQGRIRLGRREIEEIAEVCEALPVGWAENVFELGFCLWLAGKHFESEIDRLAKEWGL
jgi:hypothetical protein